MASCFRRSFRGRKGVALRGAVFHAELKRKEAERALDQAEQALKFARRSNQSQGAYPASVACSVEKLAQTIASTNPTALDPWWSTLKAPKRVAGMREKSATHHGYCIVQTSGKVHAKCALTGIIGDGDVVTNAHLLPRNAPTHHFDELDVEMDGVRNMIILCAHVKDAFDAKDLCFLVDPDRPGHFVLKIWNPKTRNKLLFPATAGYDKQTIGSYEGHAMKFPEDKIPYTRVLSLHAQCSYHTAMSNGWIDDEEPKPDIYGSAFKNDVVLFRDIMAPPEPDADDDDDVDHLKLYQNGTSITITSTWDSPSRDNLEESHR